MQIKFYEAFDEESQQLQVFINDDIDANYTWQTIQESGDTKPPAPIISIRTQSDIPEAWADQLEVIISRSTGYDHLIQYHKKTGFPLDRMGYLPLYCNRSVAEQALLLWMSLLRKLPRQIEQFHTFNRDGLTGVDAFRKAIAVVGVGNIGYEIVKIAVGFDMSVYPVDIAHKHPIEYYSIDEALEKSDIIVCAMNLTEDNHGYFDYDLLKQSKQGAIFINIARGEISPIEDIHRLLIEGHLGGVGIDVYENEKLLAHSLRQSQSCNDPNILAAMNMAKMDNVIMTPHNAFNTQESVTRKCEQTIQQLMSYTQEGHLIWSIDNLT